MTMDQIATWCGYAVMIAASVTLVLFFVYVVFNSINDMIEQAARAASESYWFIRWKRFERMAKARKNGGSDV